jgi:single-strand DNA-binding protein
MNTVTMIGTLTKDPEIRNGSGDAKICAMRIAESNGRKGTPLFINVSAFGRQAETCGKYLVKGRQVAISGQLRFREWEPEGGGKRSEHTIAADRVDFLPDAKGRRSGNGGGNGGGGGYEGEGGGGAQEGGGQEGF